MSDSQTEPTGSQINRRSFMRHAAWAGAAVAVAVTGGVVTTDLLRPAKAKATTADFTFVQISDSHLGFQGKANPDVAGTFAKSLQLVNALPDRPDFVIHTGDVTHFSTIEQFDQAKQMMSSIRSAQVLVLPGEHDAVDDAGQKYLSAFGAGTQGTGWFSFDHKGVHFVSLVNTTGQQVLGHLGAPWGWGTDDAGQALGLLRRFGSVTCLNGHVHQVMSKVEGNVTFHSCAPTAYPLAAPGHDQDADNRVASGAQSPKSWSDIQPSRSWWSATGRLTAWR